MTVEDRRRMAADKYKEMLRGVRKRQAVFRFLEAIR